MGRVVGPEINREAEESVCGAILVRPEILDSVVEVVAPEDFRHPPTALIYRAIWTLYGKGEPVDLVTVATYLKAQDSLGIAGGPTYLAGLSEQVGFATNGAHYASLVKKASLLYQLWLAGGEIANAANTKAEDVGALIDAAGGKLFALSESANRGQTRTMRELLGGMEATMAAVRKTGVTGIQTGFIDLDTMLRGLQPKDLNILAARPSMGKSLKMDAKILMYDGGWKTMREMAIGDPIASVDGQQSLVEGIFPQGKRPIYALELSDGRKVEADADHIWAITSSRWKGQRQVTTLEIGELLTHPRQQNRLRLAQHVGEFGTVTDIGVDPWLLGLLLADGCLTKSGCSVSNPESYIVDRIENVTGMELGGNNGVDWRIFHARGVPNPVREVLKVLGVMGLRSNEKFIPPIVFRAVRSVREKVLAGLLEGDGWVEKSGSVQFSSSSEPLADGVAQLVHSLSGYASKHRRLAAPKYSYRGEQREGKPAFIVSLALEGLDKILHSPRLLKNLKRSRPATPVIKSVVYVGESPAQCIKVSHPSGLFIMDGYVVTHNTALALNIAKNVALFDGPVMFFSLEMADSQLMFRLMASETGIPCNDLRSSMLKASQYVALERASVAIDRLPLYIDDTPALTTVDVRARARRQMAKTPLKLIVVDYLQLMGSSNPKLQSRNDIVGDVSSSLKSLAKELGVPVLALAQLSRECEKRPDRRPVLSDLRDSGTIEQDADVVAFIYRDEVYKECSPDAGTAEIIIRKNRNGAVGKVRLAYNGPLTKFSNYTSLRGEGE